MVVDLCQVLNPCLARIHESEAASLTKEEEGKLGGKPLLKPIVSLRVYYPMGSFPNFVNKI
jgi:hypothetical protein